MSKRVVVTGIGLMVSNGNNKEEFFNNCFEGISGLKECSLFDISKFNIKCVGEIDCDCTYSAETFDDKSRMDFIVENSLKQLFADSNLTKKFVSSMQDRVYLSFSTSLWSIEKILQYVRLKNKNQIQHQWLDSISQIIPRVKEITGVEGGCYTTTTACTSSSNAAGIAFDLIKYDKADLVIVGGVDSLNEFSFYGFNSLRALGKLKCKPFDKNRDGINIGEGGAFLVLESLEHAKARNAKIYAEILGYGINNDAYHVTSPDPNGEGAYLSMQMALEEGNKSFKDVDYVNAHGTGTILNDSMELKAMQRMIERKCENSSKKITVSSTKSLIGHCLAAAGILELVITILSIKNQVCIKNVNLDDQMEGYPNVELIRENKFKKINYAMSNNFAFAGNTSSVLVGDYNS